MTLCPVSSPILAMSGYKFSYRTQSILYRPLKYMHLPEKEKCRVITNKESYRYTVQDVFISFILLIW